jgi:hypothetical protein
LAELPQQAPFVQAVVIALDEPGPWLHGSVKLAVVHQRHLLTFNQPEEAHGWLAKHHLLATPGENG